MTIKPGSCSVPAPGWDLQVLDDNGKPMKRGEVGSAGCPAPDAARDVPYPVEGRRAVQGSVPCRVSGLLQDGDAGVIDEDGYVSVMTRVDDVINVAGHRLSTGQIEEVLASHDAVAECACVGVADEMKGQVPLGFLVLKAGVERDDTDIVREVVQMVRDKIGPVAFFKQALVVPRLPKTRSGKILRGTMQKIADGQPWKMPATIDGPRRARRRHRQPEVGCLREQVGPGERMTLDINRPDLTVAWSAPARWAAHRPSDGARRYQGHPVSTPPPAAAPRPGPPSWRP